jgi:hypothetical protein
MTGTQIRPKSKRPTNADYLDFALRAAVSKAESHVMSRLI